MSDKGSSAPPGDGEVANKATVDVSCEEEKAVTPAGAPTGAGAGAGGVGAGAGAGAGMGASAETGPPEAGSTLSTGLFYDARMCLHECPSGDHPEAPARISRIYQRLEDLGLAIRCIRSEVRDVTQAEVARVHKASYIKQVDSWLDLDAKSLRRRARAYNSVFLNPHSVMCASLSAGSVVEACELVAKGRLPNAVAVVRPPGHHAEPNEAMGFCVYNNVAVAAAAALELDTVERVLIVDWDVHHGNGTQRMFEENPNVVYFSIHRYDDGRFYPHSADAEPKMVGRKQGQGRNVNVALNGGDKGDGDYLYVWSHVLMPLAYEFAPDLVIISAGFDAALGDPLGGYRVTPPGYAHLTHQLKALAQGRLVVALEGGYNLGAISESMAAVVEVLLGDMPRSLGRSVIPDLHTQHAVAATLKCHVPYWHCLGRPLGPEDNAEDLFPGFDSDSGNEYSGAEDGPEADDGAGAVEDESAGVEAVATATPGGGDDEDEDVSAVADAIAALTVGDDGVQGFTCDPLSYCSHVEKYVSTPPEVVNLDAPCQHCETTGQDNWMCAQCYQVLCGRYANGHMMDHFEKTGHCVAVGFGDLSFWCYEHGEYLNAYLMPLIHAWYSRLHLERFGELPASARTATGGGETTIILELAGTDGVDDE